MSDYDEDPLSPHEMYQLISMEIAETALACPATTLMCKID